MSGNHGRSFIKGCPEPVRITHRLIFAYEAEFVAHMTEQRETQSGQFLIAVMAWVELLGIGQDFDQDGSCFGTAMEFFYGIETLRVD